MASFSTLTENWATIDETVKWNRWGGGNITNPGGVLQLANGPGTTNYYGIATQATYDLTGTSVSLELIALPTVILPADASFSVGLINLEIDTANRYYWSWESNVLLCYKVTAGTYTYLGEITYTAATKYIRIREASGTVYFDYSALGYGSWTNLISVATTGVAVTALYFATAIGNHSVITNTTYTAQTDNLNLMPSAPAAATNGKFFQFF